MAYTPDAQTKAALTKSRTGGKLTAAEQKLLATHSQRMVSDMTGASGSGYGSYGQNQPFDSATRTTTGLAQLNPNDLAETYQNFLSSEQERRAQGMKPRPLPVQFSQIAKQNNPLGYNLSNTSQMLMPAVNSQMQTNLIQAGIISPDSALLGRPAAGDNYTRPTTTPQLNPGVPATPTPVTSTPTPVNTTPTATLPFNPADALPSAPQTIHTPNGGIDLGHSVAGIDEGKLLAEAELQKQLRQQTYTQQVSGRQAMLNELSQTLQKQQAAMLADQMPGIYEDLNTRGLLRSSALGEKVGLEGAKLARQTSEQLALQGITDRNLAINDLSGIEDQYLAGRGTAMQRRFSLEDFDRQLAAGEKLGANALPQVSTPSGKGSSALQGGLGGAGIGAQVGGPTGAAIGGLLGAVGGGKLGGK